jgi:hypothetical protein
MTAMVQSDFSFIVGNREYVVRTVDFERLMGDPIIYTLFTLFINAL